MPDFIQLAQQCKRRIILPEGDNNAILEAASYCDQHGIADITVLGDVGQLEQRFCDLGFPQGDVQLLNPEGHSDLALFAQTLFENRVKKSFTLEKAEALSRQPLFFADLMVRLGRADACVAGKNNTTGDVIRTALQVIGSKRQGTRPSSFFIIKTEALPDPVLFADCAMNISPNAQQLADIAYQSAKSIVALLGLKPKIAMLSFSTNGSAAHRDVNKVVEATRILHQQHPELAVIGEIQFDAAVSKKILHKKWPESDFEVPANVFIFPSLDAANMAYKVAEQLGQAKATGPILQGLAKPVNDLSRGANVASIINTIAVTALQVIEE